MIGTKWGTVALMAVLASSFGSHAAYGNSIEVGGMSISWHHESQSVHFTVEAPTTGWVAIGFNDTDDIVGADLIMMRVVNGIVETRNWSVVAAGDPRPVEERGGASIVIGADGRIEGESIHFEVSLRSDGETPLHFPLEPGSELFLIAAYSVSTDFDHHSRMRRHLRVTL